MSLNIASIGETDHGGAGLSSLKLHDQFRRQGFNSKFYVNRKTCSDPDVIEMPTMKNRPKELSFAVGLFQPDTPKALYKSIPFTTGLSITCPEFLNAVFDSADVILLRWASVAISDFVIGQWSRTGKPIVWCLSDMAPITGGCHYSMGCGGYQESCSSCPALSINDRTTERTLQRRLELWENITFVAPSKWLEECVRKSLIGRRNHVEYIRTGAELDVFKPHDKSSCRKEFGIDPNLTTIFCGSASAREYRKGFSHLPALVDRLNSSELGDYQLIVVGSQSEDLRSLNCKVKTMGLVKDRSRLARIYSAADIALLPYLEDNLPNVALEAIACGAPVASFAIGGLPDVILPGINGTLATPFDVDELATRLVECVKANHSRFKIRDWATRNIDINTQGSHYASLFSHLLQAANQHSR